MFICCLTNLYGDPCKTISGLYEKEKTEGEFKMKV